VCQVVTSGAAMTLDKALDRLVQQHEAGQTAKNSNTVPPADGMGLDCRYYRCYMTVALGGSAERLGRCEGGEYQVTPPSGAVQITLLPGSLNL
jgi:hypothetical protein